MLKNMNKIKVFSMMFAFLAVSSLSAQHRGDLFSFQGLTDFNDNDAKAASMAGAVTALSGDVSLMFYNPASISDVKNIQIAVSGNYLTNSWRENQNYKPNRLFVTLPFYLEGLYTPNPEQDGMFDHERLWTDDNLIDSSYVIREPILGLDPYSEEAADWKESQNKFTSNNIAVAFPFTISGEDFTVSAAYNNIINIEDLDRNQTYLDPHIGYLGYGGDIGRVDGVDTMVMNWSSFYRKSSGNMDNIAFAVSYKVAEILNVGFSMNYSWGSTDDILYLERIGTFHLMDQQRFKFWYQDVYDEIKGTSDYSTTRFNLGFQLNLNQFKFGVKIDLPYTLQKDWNYTFTYTDSIQQNTLSSKGTDKFNFPAVYNFGIGYTPVDNFIFTIDYEYAPYNETTAEFEIPNPTFRELPDRHSFRFGAEYSPIELISIRAGYKDVPNLFIPDGSAIQTSGPSSKSYTFGFGLNTDYGKLNISYEMRMLRYYDSYYSNTNYNTNEFTNLLFGYTIEL
ncbi:MAG: hypothetical protein KKF62_19135 [Bacteroidetes bacterium]|nr:hypothetical protein [Bacteroidota bacterium]MBU1117029.1 hypothetical protein [Bacteroidota bacterium]MBU1797624.1 hypothetical protein [Bacteroidota bacterium]